MMPTAASLAPIHKPLPGRERPLPEPKVSPASAASTQSVPRSVFGLPWAAVRRVDRALMKLVGGPENVILYRFLQVLVVVVPIGVYAIVQEVKAANKKAERETIATANQEVRQAVEKVERWVRDGKLDDADEMERELAAAQANAITTEKDSVALALTAFKKAKGERLASRFLDFAVDAIANKKFDKAQAFLRQYLEHPNATEQEKANTLLSEIATATSDEDALRTVVAMDDASFSSFSNGNSSAVVLSHPVLVETRLSSSKCDARIKAAFAGVNPMDS
jgi:hypothetical protein